MRCEVRVVWLVAVIGMSSFAISSPLQISTDRGVLLNAAFGNGHLNESKSTQLLYDQNIQVKEESRPRQPRIAVRCLEDYLLVLIKADFFETGVLLDPFNLWLGSDSQDSVDVRCVAAPSEDAEYVIAVHLNDCGTALSLTNDLLIYKNVLNYFPAPTPDGVLRSNSFAIPIQCQYSRQLSSDSEAVVPTWVPYLSTVKADDFLQFSLRLMTDDWQYERTSNVYLLGDALHLEASVSQGHHRPLRVYVDHCVATPSPDPDSEPKYTFIDYHGCLVDGRLADSGSRFLPRLQDDKLHFTLDAFWFYQQPNNLVYITCLLKATPAMHSGNSQNRACSFTEEGWKSVDGESRVCGSCDGQMEEPVLVKPVPTMAVTTTATTSKAPPDQEWHDRKASLASYLRVYPGKKIELLSSSSKKPSVSTGMSKRGGDYSKGGQKTTTLGPIIVTHPQEVVTPVMPTLTPGTDEAENGTIQLEPSFVLANETIFDHELYQEIHQVQAQNASFSREEADLQNATRIDLGIEADF